MNFCLNTHKNKAVANFFSLGVLTFTNIMHKQLCAVRYLLHPSNTSGKNSGVLQHPQAPTCLWPWKSIIALHVNWCYHRKWASIQLLLTLVPRLSCEEPGNEATIHLACHLHYQS